MLSESNKQAWAGDEKGNVVFYNYFSGAFQRIGMLFSVQNNDGIFAYMCSISYLIYT